jgi:addiction module HigA family antidote
MGTDENINAGGINGSGTRTVDVKAHDFKALRGIIEKAAAEQPEDKKMEYQLLSIRFQMESYLDSEPEQFIVAGKFVQKFLDAIHVEKRDFAQYIAVEEAELEDLLEGRRKITSDTALKLGRIFKTDPALWLHVESKNELFQTSRANEKVYSQYSLQDLLRKAG